MANSAGFGIPLCLGSVVGGSMFGDNLSFISDTTIAACNGQGCAMKDKFKENFGIAFPAAVAPLIVLAVMTVNANVGEAVIEEYHLIQIIPYVLVLAGGVIGINVFMVLLIGIVSGAVIMLATGATAPTELLSNMGTGVSGMFETAMVAVLVAAICALIEEYGGFAALLALIKKVFKGQKGGKLGMGLLVGAMDIATANNKNKALSDQVNRDILTLRNEAKSFKEFFSDLSEKLEYTANLLDTQIPVIQETASFTENLKASAHINDVDFMWDDLDICKTNIERISGNIQAHQNELDTLATTSSEHKEAIASLCKNLATAEEYAVDSRNLITELAVFREEVSALNHLMEVDKIWKQTEEHQIRINQVEQEGKSHTDKLNELEQADGKMRESIDSNSHDISILKEYMGKLSGISHLDDVDIIWKDVEEHTAKILKCERRDEDLTVTIQKNKEEVNENIAEAVQTANAAIESLTKKVKYAYWIAGGSVGLSIIELILLLMKVI